MRCDRDYGDHSEGEGEWEFGVHPTDKREYEQVKLKQLKGCQGVRPNRQLGAIAYINGKVEEYPAFLTVNQTVELVAEAEGQRYVMVELEVDVVEGMPGVLTPAVKAEQGRKETRLKL